MAIRILSVDDEKDLELLLTQYFRRKIRKGEYEFAFAHNGVEALDEMGKQNFDIILSDINMPEMDGLTLLNKIQAKQNPALKCIMVSAYGDMQNIRTAMNSGAYDFVTKPIDLDDLDATIHKAEDNIQEIKKWQQEHTQLESLKTDLAVASEIQHAILPQHFPPIPDFADKVDISALMNAAKDVGGDFYDFFRVDETHFGFTIADVSGKGVPAALYMAVSRTLIRSFGLKGLEASKCLRAANQVLSKESVDCMFVTVFYGVMDVNTGNVSYCNAGHNPPYILRKDGTTEMLPMSSDITLGIMSDMDFTEKKLQLEHGDALLMFTDGVTEAINTDMVEYGEERLETKLKECSQLSADDTIHLLREDVRQYAGEAEQSDDITLVGIRRI
jgi:sigma-B regulation protein RsbU (phosphoserine phosphatase)